MQEATDYFRLDAVSVETLCKADILDRVLLDQDNTRYNQSKLNSRCSNISSSKRSEAKMESHQKRRANRARIQEEVSRVTETKFESPDTVTASMTQYVNSSTTSTNSLPSISSSPSVSPSLVCPHLSLDDILSLKSGQESPHTIGLCQRCRLSPPKNIHSPLSPIFKPSSRQYNSGANSLTLKQAPKRVKDALSTSIRKGYSDFQESSYRGTFPGRADIDRDRFASLESCNDQNLRPRDDSLDYCVNQEDLRLMQLSPTLRHSVEFIRTHSSESARVLKVYKNGAPYDKPLRVCINRGEFHSLNHLLDHINGRQLIPYGARYLFHLDGQLVYSVNELKHGSNYIVSGTRQFDFKSSQLIKDQGRASRSDGRSQYQKHTSKSVENSARWSSFHLPQLSLPSTQAKPISPTKDEVFTKESLSHTDDELISKMIPITVQPDKDEVETSEIVKKTQKIHVRPTKEAERNDNILKRPYTRKVATLQSSPQTSVQTIRPQSKRSDSSNVSDRGKVEKHPVSLVRAKSDFSSLSSARPKKNVTFLDTGRGSSPAIVENIPVDASGVLTSSPSVSRVAEAEGVTLSRNPSTSDIGIQVGDKIDGFLIDLPLPMPPRGEERKELMRKGLRSSNLGAKSGASGKPAKVPKRNIITITERQLSSDELRQFKDLHQGDHHKEEPKGEQRAALDIHPAGIVRRPSDFGLYDTTIIPCPPESKGTQVDDTDDASSLRESRRKETQKWQSTGPSPAERPVSQNSADEIVHARVITPTPSLSTAGDNSSLSMSYETPQNWSSHNGDQFKVKPERPDLPEKQRIAVKGQLRNGLNAPSCNYKLVWVNGLLINDTYPSNSSTDPESRVQRQTTLDQQSPMQTSTDYPGSCQFKPSHRFSNWVCHSRLHDELIYPVGRFVILWCRWNDEQRFYVGHSSNVSSLALGRGESDLAASAQIGEVREKISPVIHIWSVTKLETLYLVKDDQFVGRNVFSLNLIQPKSDSSESVELLVGAREDKRLWIFSCSVSNDLETQKDTAKRIVKGPRVVILRANKPMPVNQTPLMVAVLQVRASSAQKDNEYVDRPKEDAILTLGQRHFQVCLIDRKQSLIKFCSSVDKSSQYVETLAKATCWLVWSSSELLMGDSDGNINLISMSWSENVESSRKPTKTGTDPQRKIKSNYKIEKLVRLCTCVSDTKDDQPAKSQSITCLSKVSTSVLATGDTSRAVRFWRIEKRDSDPVSGHSETQYQCHQVSNISFPNDLGFICTIVASKYNRHQAIVDFYIVSTSNAILFGSVQLNQAGRPKSEAKKEILAHSSLAVVFEGHESSVVSLVADYPDYDGQKSKKNKEKADFYFTCSLDQKICKWQGKNLLWKSLLPSACASLAVHPIGFVLAVGSGDGTVYILDKISGLLISYFPLTPVCINCLAYSRDGSLLAAGCANGSIFILPVFERGLRYKKVSLFQSPHPVLNVQFSLDSKYILTSVTHGLYQELILWDLPNFRYLRNEVTSAADKIAWFDSICSGSEDVRAIWENANMATACRDLVNSRPTRLSIKRKSVSGAELTNPTQSIVNLSCHRLIRSSKQPMERQTDLEDRDGNGDGEGEANSDLDLVIASDIRGFLRLFRYPCYDIQQGFYELRSGSSPVNCCRFLPPQGPARDQVSFVSTSLDGAICLWTLE